jgi:peptide/nickel transport system permease protein
VHPVLKLVVQRVALGLLLLLAVSAVIFLGVEALPGDTAQAILGQSATPVALENLREKMGLNEPALTRYFHWLGGVLTGDLGTSLTTGTDIAQAIGQRLGNTLFLASCAAVISVPLALVLGHHRGALCRALAGQADLGPDADHDQPARIRGRLFRHLSADPGLPDLPACCHGLSGHGLLVQAACRRLAGHRLVLVVLAHMMRMTRAAILNVMQSAYIETAELKGLRPIQIIWRHAFPNAIAPIVSVVVLNLAYLVVGVVVVEVVFGYNALGQYLVDHVTKRDLPVVQAVGLVFAGVYIGLNILADVIAIVANPRLRHPK